eukprot:s6674_g6.t1
MDHGAGSDVSHAVESASSFGSLVTGLDVVCPQPSPILVPDSDSQDTDLQVAPPSPGRWCDLWNIPSDGVVLTLSMELGVVPAPPGPTSSDLDWMAYQLCRSGCCALSQLARLCLLLPSQQVAKRRKRNTSDGGTGRHQCTFSVGAFAAGGTQGVQLNTRAHPWATRLLTALVHGACSGHHFSSCSLLKNLMHYKHVDRANEPGTFNLLLPCSRWRGGQVWMADPTGSVSLDAQSGPGCLFPVQMPYTLAVSELMALYRFTVIGLRWQAAQKKNC